MIIDIEEKAQSIWPSRSEHRRTTVGGRLANLPYKDLSLIDLAEIYAYTLLQHGRGIRLSFVVDELNKRTANMRAYPDNQCWPDDPDQDASNATIS